MCGIAGIFAYGSGAEGVDCAELIRMRDRMESRGPDGSGKWISTDERVGLAHRRLSIIDLSERAAQPMQSVDGKHIIVFNGEIYNYRALRCELEAEGCVFRTDSDTEVLLHLYAKMGEAMFHRLRGMFAFAIWDLDKRALLLARDPYGIKPLYYSDVAGTVRFASQVKALLAGRRISRGAEPAGWVGFFLFGSVPEPFTVYRDIRAVPAGTAMWVDSSGVSEARRYFSLSEAFRRAEERSPGFEAAEIQECLRAGVADSVRHHMVADVPVGIFLSAGIDSGALLGVMQEFRRREIEAITIGYEEYKGSHKDETPLAAQCAAKFETRHTVRMVTQREFAEDLPRILDAMDQPTIDGVNSWFVSKAAKEVGVKAAISGLGGDEIFGGYSSFRDIHRSVRCCGAASRFSILGDAFKYLVVSSGLTHVLNPKVAGLMKYGGTYPGAYLLRRGLFLPWELNSILEADFVNEGIRTLRPLNHVAHALQPEPRTNYGKVAALESSLYMRNQLLRDTDWASMAHSVEVRVPLVDVSLLETAAPAISRLRIGMGKRYLANSPRVSLPVEIVARSKTGFETPVNHWLQSDGRLHHWRDAAQLRRAGCPWARRWAYQVAHTDQFLNVSPTKPVYPAFPAARRT
jgi:asparagine synthase (glutamine-hydrolysing)